MTKIKVEISALERQASAPHWLSPSGRFPQERRNEIMCRHAKTYRAKLKVGA